MNASIVVIGDEILYGFTQDTNSHWLAQQLRGLGIDLVRVTQIRDNREHIVATVRNEINDPNINFVFCCGGLGPTPDDRTMPAIAEALGTKLTVHEATLKRISQRVSDLKQVGLVESADLNQGHRKMAEVPEGATRVLPNRVGLAPCVEYTLERGTANPVTLYILPGVPAELKACFQEQIEPLLVEASRKAHIVKELKLPLALEATFYDILSRLEKTHPSIQLGSYPSTETRTLTLRAIGDNEQELEAVIAELRQFAQGLGLNPLD